MIPMNWLQLRLMTCDQSDEIKDRNTLMTEKCDQSDEILPKTRKIRVDLVGQWEQNGRAH